MRKQFWEQLPNLVIFRNKFPCICVHKPLQSFKYYISLDSISSWLLFCHKYLCTV